MQALAEPWYVMHPSINLLPHKIKKSTRMIPRCFSLVIVSFGKRDLVVLVIVVDQ